MFLSIDSKPYALQPDDIAFHLTSEYSPSTMGGKGGESIEKAVTRMHKVLAVAFMKDRLCSL